MTPTSGHAALAPDMGRQDLTFALAGRTEGETVSWFLSGLGETLVQKGHVQTDGTGARVVFHRLDRRRPRPFRRQAQATFVVGVLELDQRPQSPLQECYPFLIRSLSNLLICLIRNQDQLEALFITLEQGTYTIPCSVANPGGFFTQIYARVTPLASSTLVVNNIFDTDLEPELWTGDAMTEALADAGRRLDALNLLPAPFPIQGLLAPRDMQHLRRLFGIGGLSYGNLSARKDATRFWMSGSGVDKSNLSVIGQDLLLVKGYDPHRNGMLLSIPEEVKPRRVSVDAIEHWMIYTEHPQVGAIIHIHAWMGGVPSTQINFPCGTRELAKAVADLIRQAPDPSQAVIGLRNHGLTITGRDLEDIFRRIEGRIIPQVPMT